MKGIYLQKFSEAMPEHAFVEFYRPRQKELARLLEEEQPPQGIVHGDAFLDNVLVQLDEGGAIASCVLVDYEDVCVGPLIFDLACCAIGSCFEARTNQLQLPWVEALLVSGLSC